MLRDDRQTVEAYLTSIEGDDAFNAFGAPQWEDDAVAELLSIIARLADDSELASRVQMAEAAAVVRNAKPLPTTPPLDWTVG